ncbi:PepSY domain-containing protein [Macrococcus lamae]|uniref:PepSY domain-containing protein n=1 Tax=Macrococcus lamae TaxID=198484 RepID=A0A4R6BUU6_9STAP|nr:PepSY domain-containing protein [Macrococcus lamae]TDM12113.1 hypothetical protein ERX29_04665 [Macrococcus lamae]
MKFKILALLLSAGLALAACDADNSNDKSTSPDDKNKSEVDSSETNKSDDVKKNEDSNATKDSEADEEDKADDAVQDDEASGKADEDSKPLTKNDITATPDDIIRQMESDNKKGKLTNIDFENENGEWVYKIGQNEGNKKMEYTYSMKDKKLLKSEEDSVDKDEQEIDYDKILSFDEALKKAQDKTSKDAKVKEWSLESQDNVPVYEFELMDGNTEKTVAVDPYEGTANVKE